MISPDATETPGINALAGMLNPGPDAAEEFENYQRSIVPLARYATAEEVANAALFLASQVFVEPDVANRARRAVEAMLTVGA